MDFMPFELPAGEVEVNIVEGEQIVPQRGDFARRNIKRRWLLAQCKVSLQQSRVRIGFVGAGRYRGAAVRGEGVRLWGSNPPGGT